MHRTVKSKFYPEIETLRGLASLAVVLGHCYLWSFPQYLQLGETYELRWLDVLMSGIFDPQPAVLVFFVLSGFVLGCQLEASAPVTSRAYLAYIVRRLLRLIPTMWFSLVISLGLWVALGVVDESARQIVPLALTWFWRGLLFLDFSLNPVIWSLYVEVIVSALLPLMFWCSRCADWTMNAAVFLALFALCLLISKPMFLSFAVFFFVGLLISYVPRTFDKVMGGVFGLVAGVSALAVFTWGPEIAVLSTEKRDLTLWRPWAWIEVPACALLVYFVVRERFAPISAILTTPVLRFIGKISFSVYLLHFPIMIFVDAVLAHNGLAFRPELPVLNWIGLFGIKTAIVCALSVIASVASYRFVEVPSAKLGRSLASCIVKRHLALPSTF
ncbi:acyltransferase family protein [Microvirga zambiensis]|uniref:acyltransferase family protein n=1 Tax=Microvirga zambiensis TaxID=1402137 RepID=UPI00191FBD93|nr:acyltransferase [Microvirga zambiensis]